MIQPPEESTISATGRHCASYGCRKCIARAKWYRRKSWRAGKHPNRRNKGKKRYR